MRSTMTNGSLVISTTALDTIDAKELLSQLLHNLSIITPNTEKRQKEHRRYRRYSDQIITFKLTLLLLSKNLNKYIGYC